MDRKVLLLRSILENNMITQRELAAAAGVSLGTAHKLYRSLVDEGLVSGDGSVADAGIRYLERYRTEAALVLSAGFGSRFVPLTYETPKGLLEVFGEPMIERQLRQLQEAGIRDIAVMVGYRKERFEYLAEKYGVRLIYNPEYAVKNTLSTLWYARDFLRGRNCYVLNSDNWLRENLFHRYEGSAWYCAQHADGPTSEWTLVSDSKGRITATWPGGRDCDYMYGPAYFSREFSDCFLPVLDCYYHMPGTEQYYWENVLMDILNGTAEKRILGWFGREKVKELSFSPGMYVNLRPADTVYEFENLEELRLFDPRYVNDSGSAAMQLVSRVFGVPEGKIVRIRRLKAGMTNNSWLFSVDGRQYICRIPGEGTEKLIDRRQERTVYDAVAPLGITEELVYFDADTGYKISAYYENARNADPKDPADMRACMKKLRELHGSGVRVGHRFDIGERLAYYEGLCLEETDIRGLSPEDALKKAAGFTDYTELAPLKEELLGFIRDEKSPDCLCHIDSVADNFLFLGEGEDREVRLIDWEYAGMCDPHIDIAMCAIYSYMDEESAVRLLEEYLGRAPGERDVRLVFAYMALGGLLWALWGVYKEKLGVEFTDYTLKMYRYFKTFGPKALKGYCKATVQ